MFLKFTQQCDIIFKTHVWRKNIRRNKSMHEMHRSRMKKRFLNEGLETFEDHQVLEFILFYALPRIDTNVTAHILLQTFGSIHGVADASIEELMKIPNIGEHSAILLKLIPELSRRYFLDSLTRGDVYDTVDKIGEYLVRNYIGINVERVHMLLFDNGYRLIKNIFVMEGSINSAYIPIREMIAEIVKHNASMVVIAHNHPGGAPIPSKEDVETTIRIINALELIECFLLEHIIVSDNDFIPIINSNSTLRDIRKRIMKL